VSRTTRSAARKRVGGEDEIDGSSSYGDGSESGDRVSDREDGSSHLSGQAATERKGSARSSSKRSRGGDREGSNLSAVLNGNSGGGNNGGHSSGSASNGGAGGSANLQSLTPLVEMRQKGRGLVWNKSADVVELKNTYSLGEIRTPVRADMEAHPEKFKQQLLHDYRRTHGDLPELNSLQECILDCFLYVGAPLTFSEIVAYIKPIYSRLKKKDGTSYRHDIKRAVRANVKPDAFVASFLFKVSDECGGMWELTKEYEARLREQEESRFVTRSSERRHQSRYASSQDEPSQPESSQTAATGEEKQNDKEKGEHRGEQGEGASGAGHERSSKGGRKESSGQSTGKSSSSSSSAIAAPAEATTSSSTSTSTSGATRHAGSGSGGTTAAPPTTSTARLTDLQRLIVEALALSGARELTFEEMYAYVQPLTVSLRKRDGSAYPADCRRSILSALNNGVSAAIPLFKRNAQKRDSWRLLIDPERYGVSVHVVALTAEAQAPSDSASEMPVTESAGSAEGELSRSSEGGGITKGDLPTISESNASSGSGLPLTSAEPAVPMEMDDNDVVAMDIETAEPILPLKEVEKEKEKEKEKDKEKSRNRRPARR
jgi:hypothetical protein